jgi:hypothetical protein
MDAAFAIHPDELLAAWTRHGRWLSALVHFRLPLSLDVLMTASGFGI